MIGGPGCRINGALFPGAWDGSGERKRYAPLAQLDRASDYESEGQRFKSSRARQIAEVSRAVSSRGLFFM